MESTGISNASQYWIKSAAFSHPCAANAASTTAIPEAAALTVKANGTNYYKLTVDFAETNKAQNSLQGKSFGGTIIVGAAGTALK